MNAPSHNQEKENRSDQLIRIEDTDTKLCCTPISHGTSTAIGTVRPNHGLGDLTQPLFDYIVRGLTNEGKPGKLTYGLYALLHPANLMAIVTITLGVLVGGGLWLGIAALLFEGALLTLLPRMGIFRRAVERHAEQIRRSKVARQRKLLSLRMEEPHRQELERIETLVELIRSNKARRAPESPLFLGAFMDLESLVDAYIRLGIAYTERVALLSMTDRGELELQSVLLESWNNNSDSPEFQELTERRLSINRRRASHRERVERSVEAIRQQMKTIKEVVELLYAESVAPSEVEVRSDALDQLMAEFTESERILAEYDDLDSIDLERECADEESASYPCSAAA